MIAQSFVNQQTLKTFQVKHKRKLRGNGDKITVKNTTLTCVNGETTIQRNGTKFSGLGENVTLNNSMLVD